MIDLLLGVSQPKMQALKKAGAPIPPFIKARGLIDTGASVTAVDPSICTSLGLTPTGQASVLTPSTGATPHITQSFDVQIIIPHPHLARTFGAVAVIESNLASQGITVLIGRDVLRECVLIYNGTADVFMITT